MNDSKLEQELLQTAANASDDENCPYVQALSENSGNFEDFEGGQEVNPEREFNQDDLEE